LYCFAVNCALPWSKKRLASTVMDRFEAAARTGFGSIKNIWLNTAAARTVTPAK
jgi:hypothetical protein